MKVLLQWVKTNSVILFNAGSLVGTTAVTGSLGFVYWWVAARQFPPQAVGFASAATSAMILLGTFGILGLGTLLVGELPRQRGKEASLISAALITVGVVGGCFGIIFAVVGPYLSSDFQILRASIGSITLFAVGVSLTAITIVLDDAAIGLLRGGLQLSRNTFFAGAKLVALFVLSLCVPFVTGLTIYAAWVIGNAFSLAILVGLAILKVGWPNKSYLPHWGLLRKLGHTALKHHALNSMLSAPALILPVLVTVMLSATTNAWFYISWSIAGFGNIVTSSLTYTLYAVSSSQSALLVRKIRVTLSLAFLASALASCVLVLGTTQVLGLFGPSYAENAVWCLRILAIEAFPFIIKSHYVAVCRIQGRVAHAARVMLATGLLELGGAALGAYLGGLTGLSFGWFAAMCIEATFMFRTVYRAARLIDVSTGIDKLQRSTPYDDSPRIIDTLTNEPRLGQ